MNDGDWIPYANEKPSEAGVYRWKVPSKALPGMNVIFLGHMRLRGAGFENTLSPYFDHWDGWRVHVPAGTLWMPADCDKEVHSHDYAELTVEGFENVPCPYCEAVPQWMGTESCRGGTVIHREPPRFNNWWLQCCRWGATPHMADPRELARIRNGALGRIAKKLPPTAARQREE